MTIEEFLMIENARVLCGNRWLVYDVDGWVVREPIYRRSAPRIVYAGNNLNKALLTLSD